MDQIAPSLGGRIRGCREGHAWTQKELAEAAKISVTFLSEVENDRRLPGAAVLLRLANTLGVSLDYLVRGAVGEAPARRSLVLPIELAEVAEEEGWSVKESSDLIAYREMVVARRTHLGKLADAERTLTKDEWRALYDWLKSSPL